MLLAGCSKRNPLPLIPEPQSAGATGGSFELSPNCEILADGRLTNEAALLASRLRVSTGYPLNISTNLAGASDGGDIVLALDSEVSGGPEAYALYVSAEGARIHGASSAGVFYGIQTLLQLMPPAACGNRLLAKRAWEIPEAEIVDEPRFKWRGLMLDVSRHFFTKQEVEKLLDIMAFYKLNVFHWHLVDDQGWRLEIKRYPRLTEIGAWRKGVGFGLDAKSTTAYGRDGRYGGFYTQQDAREIVAYAAARHITIVPEIEMPGHSSAALAAYPELSCSGGPFSTDLPAGIFNGVYCVGKEETFTFLKNVLTEVFDLFPGPYIHLGGDEVLTNSWHDCAACQALKQKLGLQNDLQLQGYFMRRMADFVVAHHRIPIGWSEVVKENLPTNVVVMDWIGGAKTAAEQGHDVVRSPLDYCYFNLYQVEDRTGEPRAGGGFLPLEKVYSFEPVPKGLDSSLASHILGPQANVWTEYIPSFTNLEYMTFPRLLALSEVAWSSSETRDQADFARRLAAQEKTLQELGVVFHPPATNRPQSFLQRLISHAISRRRAQVRAND